LYRRAAPDGKALDHQDPHGVRQAVVLPNHRSLSEGDDRADHMPTEDALAAAAERLPDEALGLPTGDQLAQVPRTAGSPSGATSAC
jgi:hypothetical protein